MGEVPDLPQPCRPAAGGYLPDPGLLSTEGTRLFQLIGLGRATAMLPESTRPSLPGGVTAVPVSDAPAMTTRIVWPSHSRSPAVAALVRVAAGLRPAAGYRPVGASR